MRAKLLPLLEKQFNPAVVEHLAALAERAREQASLVEQLAGQILQKDVTFNERTARIGLQDFLHPFAVLQPETANVLRARLIQEIAGRVRAHRGQILAGHIEAIIHLAQTGEPGKRLQLPGEIDVRRERDALVFQPRRQPK